MKRLGRKGRILKWAGLGASLLIATAWAMSMFTTWNYGLVQANRYFPRFSLYDGRVALSEEATLAAARGGQWSWHLNPIPHLPAWHFAYEGGPPYLFVISLWIPFLLIIISTAALWWRDRPFPTGHCQQCGYDLTGNISGTCPECGAPTPTPTPKAPPELHPQDP